VLRRAAEVIFLLLVGVGTDAGADAGASAGAAYAVRGHDAQVATVPIGSGTAVVMIWVYLAAT